VLPDRPYSRGPAVTWAIGIAVALVVATVVFAVLRRFRRAGGVLAIPSPTRPTANVVNSSTPRNSDSPTGTASTAATPILTPNADATEGSE
jgi:hypothetical protein